jgi:hypothetical protein
VEKVEMPVEFMSPLTFPTKLLEFTIPSAIVTPVPTLSVEKVEMPVEFISPVTLPVKVPEKLGEVIIPVVFTFPVSASTDNPFPVRGSDQLVKNNLEYGSYTNIRSRRNISDINNPSINGNLLDSSHFTTITIKCRGTYNSSRGINSNSRTNFYITIKSRNSGDCQILAVTSPVIFAVP